MGFTYLKKGILIVLVLFCCNIKVNATYEVAPTSSLMMSELSEEIEAVNVSLDDDILSEHIQVFPLFMTMVVVIGLTIFLMFKRIEE